MSKSTNEVNVETYSKRFFNPNTSASKVLIPILDSLNWHGDSRKMIEALIDDPDNLDTDGLLETMTNLNFRFYNLRKFNKDKIDCRMLPVLLVEGSHHYVLISIEGNEALIFDGDDGKYKQIKTSDIKGEIYYFKYFDSDVDSLLGPQNNWFTKMLFRFRKTFAYVIFITFLITILDLLMPAFVVIIFDKIIHLNSVKTLIITFLGVILYILASFSLNHFRALLLNYVSIRIGNIITSQTFSRLVYLSPTYTETASSSSQISRIKDFENVKNFITSTNFISIFNLMFIFVYICALVFMGGWIGFIPIGTLIILLALGFIMRPFHKVIMEKLSNSSSQRQQSIIEILKNANNIKTMGTKDNWEDRIKNFIADSIIGSYNLSKYVSLTNNISFFISNASILIIFYGGVQQVISNKMSSSLLIGCLMLTWRIMPPIRGSFSLITQISGLFKSISQINRFMILPQDNNLKNDMTTKKDLRGYINFQDVSIRYNVSSNPALMGVSFSASPGEIVGFTGHDGSGKSTILKLILGMYQPQGGRIIIDDMNIKQLEPLSIRKSVSYSPEKDMIISGTLRENFRSYNPEVTDQDIIELSKQTGLYDYLNYFKESLDTYMDENFIQTIPQSIKKLINITRMIARKSNIYLIDEPENYLNENNIEKVIETIRKLSKIDGACVIISSKDERILNICTKVVKLNKGREIK